MLFSYNWLKEYVPELPTPEEVMQQLTVRSVEVEGIHSAAKAWNNIVVGEIKSVEKHPNADKLRVCQVDAGESTEQIVCGGSNIELGMKVVLARVGAQVKWHGKGDLVTLAPVKLRGVESNGMICSSDEVGLADRFPKASEKEILDLSSLSVIPGTPLAEALKMNDVMIEIDNKSMTHRADLFSHYFMAREMAAVFDVSVKDVISELPALPETSSTVPVKITDPKECRRYLAIKMTVAVGKTPEFIAERLHACGMKSINNVVDITNYVMLELGQPLHAFDADAVTGTIQVRRAKADEVLAALDHTDKKLNEHVLVIADDQRAIGVAGVIGGMHSGVTEKTTRIILEIANFDPVVVRRSAQRVGVRTESALRFEKGPTPELVKYAAQRAVQLLLEYAGATIVSVNDAYPTPIQPAPIELSLSFLKSLSGKKWAAKEAMNVLQRLGCDITQSNSRILNVTPPWFRKDLNIPEDIVEEVVRIAGIDQIPEQKLSGVLEVPHSDKELHWVNAIKEQLRGMGLFEVLNYSFYGEALIKKVGLLPDKEHLEIQNPLSDEQRYLRVNLLPRMLENVTHNQFLTESVQIFEIGHVYFADREVRQLGIVVSEKQDAFRKVKGIVEALLGELGIVTHSQIIQKTAECEFWSLYAGQRALEINVEKDILGTVGEVDQAVLDYVDIKKPVAFALLSVPVLAKHASKYTMYNTLSPYPAIPLDLSIIVNDSVAWSAIESLVRHQGGELLKSIQVFDVYTGNKIPEGKKSIAFHLILQSQDRTLEMKEVEQWREGLMKELTNQFGAILRD